MSSTSCERQPTNTDTFSEVNHTSTVCENLKSVLFLNPEYSDVYLVVEGETFSAHKVILAARSHYFRALLYGGMKESTQTKIELKGATTTSFKILLKYVYTGRMAFTELKEEVVLNILGLSDQWGFEDLVGSICEFLKDVLHVGNVCGILDAGLAFGIADLVETCAVFADLNAGVLMDHPSFMTLTPAGITELISRDTFYCLEENIFQCVHEWVIHNEVVHANAADVLRGVRLPLMNINTLLETVRPTGLVSPELILAAIYAQNKSRDTELPHRGYLVPEENVAHVKHGATVLTGKMRQAVLNGDIQNYDDEHGYTTHSIEGGYDGGGGIILGLKQQCILNHISILLWDLDLRSYSYYIEVSIDLDYWVRIVDHTNYHCRSWQNIYFPQRVVKFIKIVGTHNTANETFHVVTVQAYYTHKEFTLDPTWGLLVPKENVATIELSACVIEGVSRSRNTLINGETTGYDVASGYTYHEIGEGAIIVQLAQPFVISMLKLLLWDCDDRYYSFYVEVSTNRGIWEMVANKSEVQCKSWQTLTFAPVPVCYIRIVGTHNSANQGFHCVHFGCSFVPEENKSSSLTLETESTGTDETLKMKQSSSNNSPRTYPRRNSSAKSNSEVLAGEENLPDSMEDEEVIELNVNVDPEVDEVEKLNNGIN